MNIEALRSFTTEAKWREIAESASIRGEAIQLKCSEFDTYWIEAGHRIREQIRDDKLLCELLRGALTQYAGHAVDLYRGENLVRWNAGVIGLCWTTDIEVARMFGRGLNATKSGGVLLKGRFAPAAIISGPNSHSNYLQENQFTVDPSMAANVFAVEQYSAL